MVHFKIEIVSDSVCPWCYVGQKKLLSAINTFQSTYPSAGHTFSLHWKPYYLNPNSPPYPGADKVAYYTERFGANRIGPMHERLSAIGRQVGINFKYGGRLGNTRDSHRLIYLASAEAGKVQRGVIDNADNGMQNKVVSALFKAYFEEEKNITDTKVLLACAVEAGLDKVVEGGEGAIRGWLEGGGDEGGEVVDREVKWAKMRGVTGVPNFTINGKYQVGGAQDSGEFVEIFKGVVEGEGK